jgi:hypothetical protein
MSQGFESLAVERVGARAEIIIKCLEVEISIGFRD